MQKKFNAMLSDKIKNPLDPVYIGLTGFLYSLSLQSSRYSIIMCNKQEFYCGRIRET